VGGGDAGAVCRRLSPRGPGRGW